MRRFSFLPEQIDFDLPRPRKVALRASWRAVKASRCVPEEESASLDGFHFTFQPESASELTATVHRYSLRARDLADGSTRISVRVESAAVDRWGNPDHSAGFPLFLLKEKALAELERMAPAGSLFVSYRHDDSADATGRILDRLRARFGRDSMFLDVDAIAKGVDFRRAIEAALGDARLLLTVIGPRWTGGSVNRLEEPDDPVRFELETAFARRLPILPLLVSGADMPEEAILPASLRFLVDLNAARVRAGSDFERDIRDLVDILEPRLDSPGGG